MIWWHGCQLSTVAFTLPSLRESHEKKDQCVPGSLRCLPSASPENGCPWEVRGALRKKKCKSGFWVWHEAPFLGILLIAFLSTQARHWPARWLQRSLSSFSGGTPDFGGVGNILVVNQQFGTVWFRPYLSTSPIWLRCVSKITHSGFFSHGLTRELMKGGNVFIPWGH